MPSPTLILASASPRRLDLLARIGVTPSHVIPAEIDETPGKKELPEAHALRLAEEKARHVAARHPGAVVLAADTVVACGRRILPKAEDEAAARHCLKLLSGRRHRVITGVSIMNTAGKQQSKSVTSRVAFKPLHADEITAYLASGEWHGKAGGYGIQGSAEAFITWLSGSYSNIVGLPLYETRNLLTQAGINALI